jgi:hypothetical protein
MELVSEVGRVESRFSLFEIVLVSMQDGSMIGTKHTIGREIILDALDGTPRRRGSSESSVWSIWRSCYS